MTTKYKNYLFVTVWLNFCHWYVNRVKIKQKGLGWPICQKPNDTLFDQSGPDRQMYKHQYYVILVEDTFLLHFR